MIRYMKGCEPAISLATNFIARFVQLGRDRGWRQSTYHFDRCWDLSK
jgi:hypothetical protein